jgi:hypothetical protein
MALVVRGYNIGEGSVDVTLGVWRDLAHATRVDLNEQATAGLVLQSGRQVKLSVRPKEIVTIRFDLA